MSAATLRLTDSMFQRTIVGARGEDVACRYIKKKGMQILCRNWRHAIGELDILAIDGKELVAVEVKTRIHSSLAERHLFDAITAGKQRKLRMLIELYYLQNQRVLGPCVMRIDGIGVLLSPARFRRPKIQHLRNIC